MLSKIECKTLAWLLNYFNLFSMANVRRIVNLKEEKFNFNFLCFLLKKYNCQV